MSKYMTKQRALLLGYLSEHADELLTVKKIAQGVQSEGMSLSAVYRNLAELEKEQKIKKLLLPGCREAGYQYADAHACAGILHLSCKSCGRIYHMDRDASNALVSEIERAEKFSIDRAKTVIYGVCPDCKKPG